MTDLLRDDLPFRFVGGYSIPLRIARNKLLVALNYEFSYPPWASHQCDPGARKEGETLQIHFNNYFFEHKDLHPCYTHYPYTMIPGHMWIATHSEPDEPEGGGNLQENEHDLRIKAFLLTEGKLDVQDVTWRCMWRRSNTLDEEALIPHAVPRHRMFWAKLTTDKEAEEFLARAREIVATYNRSSTSTSTTAPPESM
ncbi:hypothetical protein QCA50_011180 [Cerrena zonata]|uniref:Uncharacterized protein n=1 Tax=Cerrena zonata TaxID=2478898 RepID=A0AAW0G3E4_9APHY